MRRKLVLDPVGYTPPPTVAQKPDGTYEVDLELRRLFHQLYIDAHSKRPKRGTNPYFDAYENLLEKGTPYLVFGPDGIAVSDHKESKSQELGRAFARGYLNQHHHYTWFAHVSELMKQPRRGWTCSRLGAGDLPDWLASDGAQVSIVEAKGTHGNVSRQPRGPIAKWRRQVRNVHLEHNGTAIPAARLKTWIVATRWVSSLQPRTVPKMLCDDPEPTDPLGPEIGQALSALIAAHHVARNLGRINYPTIATRIFDPNTQPTQTKTWVRKGPRFAGEPYVGRVIRLETLTGGTDLLAPYLSWWWAEPFLPIPPPLRAIRDVFQDPTLRAQLDAVLQQEIREILDGLWFDGCTVRSIRAVLEGGVPRAQEPQYEEDAMFSDDGSVLAPLSIMQPTGESVQL